MDANDIIILGYKDGPVHGTTVITVDAPGFTQAEFVIASSIIGTPAEQETLRAMMAQRTADNHILKDVPL